LIDQPLKSLFMDFMVKVFDPELRLHDCSDRELWGWIFTKHSPISAEYFYDGIIPTLFTDKLLVNGKGVMPINIELVLTARADSGTMH
jgi:hypothetical protein